jgi:hypothetical protein
MIISHIMINEMYQLFSTQLNKNITSTISKLMMSLNKWIYDKCNQLYSEWWKNSFILRKDSFNFTNSGCITLKYEDDVIPFFFVPYFQIMA